MTQKIKNKSINEKQKSTEEKGTGKSEESRVRKQ